MSLLSLWATYTFFGVTAFSLLFIWAVRHRQFSDQERARHMALHAPEETRSASGVPDAVGK